MKQVKNTKLKGQDSLKCIKDGKIKKNTQKIVENAANKTLDLKLVSKKEGTNFKQIVESGKSAKKNAKRGIESIKQKRSFIQEGNGDLIKVASSAAKEPKNYLKNLKSPDIIEKSVIQVANINKDFPKKKKETKDKHNTLESKTLSEEKNNAEFEKIEKKKAKNLANKLKHQKKVENKDNNKEETTMTNSKFISNDFNEIKSPITNSFKNLQESGTSANKNLAAISNKVLSKKEKNAKKRELMKDLTEKLKRDPVVESATVFVGNLPVNTKRVQLIKIFKNVGPVKSVRLRSAGGQILYKHKQRKLAGALNAYVVLESKEKAEKALLLNGSEFKGNHLRVNLATKKSLGEGNFEAKRTVFIGNLKYSASEDSLREIFSSCGGIDYIRCLRDGDKGCKGVAYVCFKTADAVGLALELNQTIVDDRPINVERYNVKKLEAKQSREAQAKNENRSKMGAKLRIEAKKGQNVKKTDESNDFKKAKKSEFRGVKVVCNSIKKKQKSKNKKCNNQMLQLAKKIAPKPKN